MMMMMMIMMMIQGVAVFDECPAVVGLIFTASSLGVAGWCGSRPRNNAKIPSKQCQSSLPRCGRVVRFSTPAFLQNEDIDIFVSLSLDAGKPPAQNPKL